MNDANLSKLDPTELNELLSARPEQLKTSDPMVMAYAEKANITPEDLLDKLQNGRNRSRFLVPGRTRKAEEYSNDINAFLQNSNMTYAEFAEKANRGGKELTGEGAAQAVKSFGMLKGLVSMENPEGYNEKAMTAQAGEMVVGFNKTATAAQKAKAVEDLSKVGERMGDQVTAAGAAGQDAARYSLNQMTDDIRKAAAAASQFGDVVVDQANKISAASRANAAGLPQGSGYNADAMNRFMDKVQFTPNPNMSVQPTGVPESK
jgi:hypothetical protein